MSDVAAFAFETAYRQLTTVERAFVDDFVSRVEHVHETTGRDLLDVLQTIDVKTLPERDQAQLSRALVRVAIQDRVQDLKDAQNISPRRITKRLAAMAFSTIDDFRTPGASIMQDDAFDLDMATPEQRSAVKKVKFKHNIRTGQAEFEFELHDSLRAMTLLCQLAGYLNKDAEPINSEKYAAQGGIPSTASDQDAQDAYYRAMQGDA